MFRKLTLELMALTGAILHTLLALFLAAALMLTITTAVLGAHFALDDWLKSEVCHNESN